MRAIVTQASNQGQTLTISNDSHGKGRIIIPGLDPETPYYSRLSSRSALYTEFHLLLNGQQAALSSAEYRSLVLQHNCLARASVSVRRKLWKEIKARYRLDSDDPLFAAFWAEWRRCESESERGLTAYILLALNDRLVTDLGTEFGVEVARSGETTSHVFRGSVRVQSTGADGKVETVYPKVKVDGHVAGVLESL